MKPIMGLLAGLLVLQSAQGWADVYAYQDEAGIEHFTNAPADDDRFKVIVVVLGEDGATTRAQAAPVVGNVALYAPLIEAAAAKYKVEKALLHAVITAESGYNPVAVSRAGAEGLMQLIPKTAKRYDVADAFDPAQNIRGGAHYLRDLLDLFGGDIKLALAGYNAGEGAVIRHGGKVPPYPETQGYVQKVLGLFRKYNNSLL